jgi:hypothetical protein
LDTPTTVPLDPEIFQRAYPALRLASWLPAARFIYFSAPPVTTCSRCKITRVVRLFTSRTPTFFLQISARVLLCLSVWSPCCEFAPIPLSASSLIAVTHIMATPAMNFVAVCANTNLQLPTSKSRQQAFLKDSGAAMPTSTSTAEVKERAASLVWLRHTVANNIPPDT